MTELDTLIKEQQLDDKYGHRFYPRKQNGIASGIRPFNISYDPAILDIMTDKGLPEYDDYNGWHRDDV